MAPPRRSKSGLNYRTWIKSEAARSVASYKKRVSPSTRLSSPKTVASIARLRSRARSKVATSKIHNAITFNKNTARVMKMMKAIANYEARRKHKLVLQPNMSYSLARRN
jgi:hypothetical protein